MELQLHEYQLSILRELLFKPNARFSELKKLDIPNDHFTFHLNKLIKEGIVEKKSDKKYVLTTEGKEFANRMDIFSNKLERQPKVTTSIEVVRINKGKKEYLLQKRLKEPFFGWYGAPTGKVKWGETPEETARRELVEETGLTGNFKLKCVSHYHHIHKDGTFLEDKYFFCFLVTNPKGDFIEKTQEGENIWVTEKEFKNLKNTFATFEEARREVYESKKFQYIFKKKIVDSY